MSGVIVETKYGAYRGEASKGVYVWRGIPYAKPPVGSRRFRAPQPLDARPLNADGTYAPGPVRDATRFSPAAMQPKGAFLSRADDEVTSEDCLYLNIWSPAPDGQKRPVMVWIHGGAFVIGSGSTPLYDGTSFAKNGDVVLVTLNYRLGAFGFLCLDEFDESYVGHANCGLLDQIAALNWVQENIEAFGGDKDKVTVFGESAGGFSIAALLTMPAAKGLFRSAIIQSGGTNVWSRESGRAVTRSVLEKVGMRPDNLDASVLRDMPTDKLMDAQISLGLSLYLPTVDGTVITEHPMDALLRGVAKDIPLIIGCNKDEFNLFSVFDRTLSNATNEEIMAKVRDGAGPLFDEVAPFYDKGDAVSGQAIVNRFAPMMTYCAFVLRTLAIAEAQARGGESVYVYRFDWRTPMFGLGACHALELPFVFNNTSDSSMAMLLGMSPSIPILAEQMHHAWIGFAHHGRPETAKLPEWPAYHLDTRNTMVFDVTSRVEPDVHGEERRVWDAALQASGRGVTKNLSELTL